MNSRHIVEFVTLSKILFRLSMISMSFGVVDQCLLLEMNGTTISNCRLWSANSPKVLNLNIWSQCFWMLNSISSFGSFLSLILLQRDMKYGWMALSTDNVATVSQNLRQWTAHPLSNGSASSGHFFSPTMVLMHSFTTFAKWDFLSFTRHNL